MSGIEATPFQTNQVGGEFITMEAARQLVVMTMSDRLDKNHALLPLEEESVRIAVPNGPTMMPAGFTTRHDIVLPPKDSTIDEHPEGGKVYRSWGYNIQDTLYSGLTLSETAALSLAEIERVDKDRAALEQTLNARNGLLWRLDLQQEQDAYQIRTANTAEPGSGRLMSPLRIYITGGLQAMGIARDVIEQGADFAAAKIWAVQPAFGEQVIRYDAPIFIANTERQLASIIGAVRSTVTNSSQLLSEKHASPLGIPIAGVPGAMAAQPRDSSFNGEMSKFFAEPVTVACNHPDLALRAGDLVTSGWFDAAAQKTRRLAQQQAEAAGLHPQSHALVSGQDLGVIITATQYH